MRTAVTLIALIATLHTGAAAADLHATIQGQWVVDEMARLAASPLYTLSSPERKKALEAGLKTVPATRFVFTATTVTVVGGDPVAYTIAKRTANSLVIATAASADGLMPKDEMTIEYVSDAALKLTAKSQGITLRLNRVK